jgi:asparagine synthase (glutamine-hydrolysing)
MCGITGIFSPQLPPATETCRRMADQLQHRGPDDAGVWQDPEAGVALGHTRLSIQDVSLHGHQPMVSPSERYILSYNGEIYNFKELHKELKTAGVTFRGHSDTEILLTAIETWGMEQTLPRLTGMFAFALWDRSERVLTLARDRMGEKPLYYGWQGKSFLFASELKALTVHPDWQGEIDRDALTLYMRYHYIPAPHSIYKNVFKLSPGTFLQISPESPTHPSPKPYWQIKNVAEQGVRDLFKGDDHEAVNALDNLLRDTIRGQMISDVPLGAFLSGGIDSSTVVALMQAESNRQVKTFTIGFHEGEFNEADQAKAVARHLGTEHTELYVTPQQSLEVIPRLPQLYDEPFADPSQIPTFLVSEMTRREVTVGLSGDGGDEQFCGYNRYFLGRSLWNKMHRVPLAMRRTAAVGMNALSARQWSRLLAVLRPILPEKFLKRMPDDKLFKLASALTAKSPDEMYRNLVTSWNRPHEVVLGGKEPHTLVSDPTQWPDLDDFVQRMQFFDSVSYLPDDILVKVDRAAMGVSLETRVPFLDHRVVEFAWRVPLSMKIRNGQGKWLLRKVLQRYVPQSLIERPKMGFSVPIDHWLRHELRDWAEALLNENRLNREGFFDATLVRHKWQEHLSGKRNWQYLLWDVLMFQAWLDHWQPA